MGLLEFVVDELCWRRHNNKQGYQVLWMLRQADQQIRLQ